MHARSALPIGFFAALIGQAAHAQSDPGILATVTAPGTGQITPQVLANSFKAKVDGTNGTATGLALDGTSMLAGTPVSTLVAQAANALPANDPGLATAKSLAAAALPAAALPTTPFLLPGTTNPQTLTQMLSPTLTAYQYSAHCDGDGHDDAPQFQAMFNAAALSGQPMTYSGKCYLAETITIGAAPGGLISLSPVGEGEIDTNGQDLIKAVPPKGVAGSVLYKFDLQRNEVHSLGSTPNTGRLLYVDCTTYGNFCTKSRSTITLNHLYNMAGAFYGSEISGVDIDRNVSEHTVPSGAENFIEVHGDNGNCSSGIYTDDNLVVGGTFEFNNGCVQGFKNKNNNQLLGFFGVFDNAPSGVEDVSNIDNYFEDGAEGIYEPNIDGTTDIGNTFDPNPTSNGGMNANWHAIVVGDPNGGAPSQAANVSLNKVFNFSGQQVNTVFVVNAGGGSAVIGNHVTGLIGVTHCMQVGTTNGTGYAAPVMEMNSNNCWASGDMVAIGPNLSAHSNHYTLAANYALPILFEAGPIQPSSVTASGNISGLNDYASGAVFSPQYLPGTAGTALRLGDVGGVTLTGNLTTQVNLYAKGALFSDTIDPYTSGQQINLGSTGGVNFFGPLGTSASSLVINSSYLQVLNGPVLAPAFRFIGAPIPTSATSPCDQGTIVVGAASFGYGLFDCYGTNQWASVTLNPGVTGSPASGTGSGTNGTNGTNGASYLTGTGAPASSLGSNGDSYSDNSTGEIYTKSGGAWTDTGKTLHGAAGTNGTNGTNGTSPTLAAGTAAALASTASPTVSDSGSGSSHIFNFGIPAGTPGANGSTPTFQIGTVSTLAAGSNATVSDTVSGLQNTLNFGIPQGAAGSGSSSAAPYTSPTLLTGAQTLTSSMCGQDYQSSDAAAVTYTVPSGLTNCRMRFVQGGAGAITFVGATTPSAVTVNSVGNAPYTAGQWATVVLRTLNTANSLVLGTD